MMARGVRQLLTANSLLGEHKLQLEPNAPVTGNIRFFQVVVIMSLNVHRLGADFENSAEAITSASIDRIIFIVLRTF